MYLRDASMYWPLVGTLSNDELQVRPYLPPRARSSAQGEPDYPALH